MMGFLVGPWHYPLQQYAGSEAHDLGSEARDLGVKYVLRARLFHDIVSCDTWSFDGHGRAVPIFWFRYRPDRILDHYTPLRTRRAKSRVVSYAHAQTLDEIYLRREKARMRKRMRNPAFQHVAQTLGLPESVMSVLGPGFIP